MMMKKEDMPDLSWLENYRTDQPHFGLERMERMLALRGNPHLKLSVIHIAGTNGKGSTLAQLRQLLEARGLQVGTFSSPYLVSYNEQIAINGAAISKLDLEELLQVYQALCEEEAADLQGLTEFEILTALAYDYFALKGVDVVLMEVGMGGLLDSTNVCQPDLTAITTIGLDHVALLGPSLEAIAEQKAGIVKPGIPLVTGRLEPAALAVVEKIAGQKGAPHALYGQAYKAQPLSSSAAGESFSFSNAFREDGTYETALLGPHQVDNAALALQLCDLYCQLKGLPLLTDSQVAAALAEVCWPGRLEQLAADPVIILDGAHNPHAVHQLTAALAIHYPTASKQILFSCIQTKALEEMVSQLAAIPQSQLTLTSFEDPRSFSPASMQELAQQKGLAYADWQEFLRAYLRTEHQSDQVLVITGSLYFLAQVRPFIIKYQKEIRSK